MQVPIHGEVVEWRGPAPYYFLPIRGDAAEEVVAVAADLTYGWGVVPVTATAGATRWTTSLIPRSGGYLLPLKDAVRAAEGIDVGDLIDVVVELGT